MSKHEDWMEGCIRKRTPDALVVLMDLLIAGLRKGEVSANDVQEREWAEPNVIGCTFRLLPKLGFEHTDRRVRTTSKRKHNRKVDVWILHNHRTALRFRDTLTKYMLGQAMAKPVQQEMEL